MPNAVLRVLGTNCPCFLPFPVSDAYRNRASAAIELELLLVYQIELYFYYL